MPPIKAFREKPYKYRGDRREVSALSDVPGHGGPLPEPEADATAAPPLRVAKGAKGEPPRSRAPVRERPSAPERAERRLPKSSSTGTVSRVAPPVPAPAPAIPNDPARPTIAEATSLTKSRSAAALGARSGALPPLHRHEAAAQPYGASVPSNRSEAAKLALDLRAQLTDCKRDLSPPPPPPPAPTASAAAAVAASSAKAAADAAVESKLRLGGGASEEQAALDALQAPRARRDFRAELAIHNKVFAEVTRQVSVHCAERGALLEQLQARRRERARARERGVREGMSAGGGLCGRRPSAPSPSFSSAFCHGAARPSTRARPR